MPRPCSICTHEKKQEIDQALIEGHSFRIISHEYNVSVNALGRHKRNGHISDKLIKAEEIREVVEADGLIEKLRYLQKETLLILQEAKDSKQNTVALYAIGRATNLLELQAKLAGRIEAEKHLHLHVNPEWIELRTRILRIVEPFPEVKQRLIEALS